MLYVLYFERIIKKIKQKTANEYLWKMFEIKQKTANRL